MDYYPNPKKSDVALQKLIPNYHQDILTKESKLCKYAQYVTVW